VRLVRFGSCTIDLEGRRLYRDGQEVHITPKAFDLLKLLVEHRQRALSKAELSDHIWPGTYVTEDGLARLVNEIRSAIGDDARRPRWIRTVHAFGYAFESTAAVQVDEDAAGHYAVRWASRDFPLQDGENVIGRDPGLAISIDAPIISRRHARIVVNGAGAVVEDLGSKNGTYVAGERITGPTPLRDGDQIQIGDFHLQFHEAKPLPTQTQPV
jgi:DNA-binding winged helix-turn-helix (wHTH) protein